MEDLLLIKRFLKFLKSKTLYEYIKSKCSDCYYIEIKDFDILDNCNINFKVLVNSFGYYDEKEIIITDDEIVTVSDIWAKAEENEIEEE